MMFGDWLAIIAIVIEAALIWVLRHIWRAFGSYTEARRANTEVIRVYTKAQERHTEVVLEAQRRHTQMYQQVLMALDYLAQEKRAS